MDDGKFNPEGRTEGLSNMAASDSSTLLSEPRANQPELELPPPYSQVPLSQFPNQPVIHNPVQQQNTWNSQGYPPYPYPGTPQQPPFQHGVFPPQSADEVRLRQESAIRQGIANNVTVISRTYHRRSCTYRLARLGIAFLVVGISLLIMLGVIVIRPTLNDMQLQSSRCTVISSEYTQEDMSCDCGRYCTSYYPCLQIQVFYFAKGKRQIAYLYQDVYDDKNKCSVQSCSSDEYLNQDDVQSFESAFGTVGDSYTCYYNPKTPNEVFKHHSGGSSDKTKIMHCILWPMLIVVLSVFLLGVLFCRSKGHCCFKKNGSSVPYQDLQATA